jgi:alpha-L-fucosidase
MHTQRYRETREWPNPIVVKLTHVEPALTPPIIETTGVKWDAATKTAACEGDLKNMGDSAAVEVGFETRDITGMDWNERTSAWMAGKLMPATSTGAFKINLDGLLPGKTYEVRAVVKHPLITLYGKELKVKAP